MSHTQTHLRLQCHRHRHTYESVRAPCLRKCPDVWVEGMPEADHARRGGQGSPPNRDRTAGAQHQAGIHVYTDLETCIHTLPFYLILCRSHSAYVLFCVTYTRLRMRIHKPFDTSLPLVTGGHACAIYKTCAQLDVSINNRTRTSAAQHTKWVHAHGVYDETCC